MYLFHGTTDALANLCLDALVTILEKIWHCMGVSATCGEGVALLDAWDVINAVHCVCQPLTNGGMPGQWVLLIEAYINVITKEAIHPAMFSNRTPLPSNNVFQITG